MLRSQSWQVLTVSLVCGVHAAPVRAQWDILAGTGALEWQARTPLGWQGGTVFTPAGGPLEIRLLLSWDVPTTGRTWTGGTRMKVQIDNCGNGDAVRDQFIPIGVPNFTPNRAGTAQRYGDIIEIDRDDLPPGQGSGWILADQSQTTSFSFDNPIVAYTFTLDLDGTEGMRTITSVHRRIRQDLTDPALRMVIIEPDVIEGRSFIPTTELRDLRIVVPAPATVLLVAFAAIPACTRRRRN